MDKSNPEGVSSISKRRREFQSYASVKTNEIEEQRLSWRYYHAAQWSKKQLEVLRKRSQPEITFDRISRKIDGLAGTVRRLRTDPKAWPRTQHEEEAADVATQVVRTILDGSHFEDIEGECVRDAAVHGIGVSELTIIADDQGDPDLEFIYTDPRTFFYDPRSVKGDFSDARFMGTYKWVGVDEIEEIAPGASDAINGADNGSFTAFDTDREILWVDEKNRYRLVDHWFIERGTWKWCLHIGSTEIASGDSPFFDGRGRSVCKYFAFANLIDHDGDHYGYVRRLRGPQDAMNQHRSKAMHIMNTRQIIVRNGAVGNAKDGGSLEKLRREAVRPDGIIEYFGEKGDLEISQPAQEFLQQTQYFQDAKAEIETFGPNQALLGDLGQSASGRAYAMAQQAGLAELGPFMKNYRAWKLAQYEAAWCAAQRYWTAERMLRVTDDQGAVNFLKINGTGFDQMGQPALVNSLAAINVDILLEEGPDTETVMGDVFDTMKALAASRVPIPPQAVIEASPLPGQVKKKLIGMLSQPDPMKQQAAQLELAGKDAAVTETKSKAALNIAKAQELGMRQAQPSGGQQLSFDLPPQVQIAAALADISETNATADHKRAQAAHLQQQTQLEPIRALHEMSKPQPMGIE